MPEYGTRFLNSIMDAVLRFFAYFFHGQNPSTLEGADWKRIATALLIAYIAFDLIWTFSLLKITPITNSREIWLLRITDHIQ